MCKQIRKIQSYTLVHPYWHLFQLPHDFSSINSSPKSSWSFQSSGKDWQLYSPPGGSSSIWCPGSTMRQARHFSIFVWLLIHGRWPPVAAVLQYPLAKVCQVTAKLLFESCFLGYFPSVCCAHNLQSYSRSFGFLSWGWSSIPFDMRRSQFRCRRSTSNPMEHHSYRRADPSSCRLSTYKWVSWRAGTRWDFSSFLMAASHGPNKVLKGAWWSSGSLDSCNLAICWDAKWVIRW